MHEKPAVCLGFMACLRHCPVYSVSGAFHVTQVSAKITAKDHRKWSLHHSRAGLLHLIFCPCCFVYGALASGIFLNHRCPPDKTCTFWGHYLISLFCIYELSSHPARNASTAGYPAEVVSSFCFKHL